ncbi:MULTISPECIES: hypothetical protein [unclassified Jeotgalibaca]|uniref:hypothetical protein n=1 Tax=unclassified Jeotgalibaca TaxID=2621505 RepID=UPI003FD26B9E
MEKVRFGTTLYMGDNSLEHLAEFENERLLIVTDGFIASSQILETVLNYFSSTTTFKLIWGKWKCSRRQPVIFPSLAMGESKMNACWKKCSTLFH